MSHRLAELGEDYETVLKIDEQGLLRLEQDYPGIRESVLRFEAANLPQCPDCGSPDTAQVQVGVVGRSISVAAATTRIKLIPNGQKPGEFFCNGCGLFFEKEDCRPDDAKAE